MQVIFGGRWGFDQTIDLAYTLCVAGDIATKNYATKTYSFKVVLEPDADAWRAYCPALEAIGGATWGASREEALKHINEVVQMIVQELVEDGEPVPEDIKISDEPIVSVTL